ncbi:MAG: hypothetical protein WAW42_01545, partial [Candidatus Competibacteraceae bacterium]
EGADDHGQRAKSLRRRTVLFPGSLIPSRNGQARLSETNATQPARLAAVGKRRAQRGYQALAVA